MADKKDKDPKTEAEGVAAQRSARSRKGLALGGGAVGAVALAYLTFLMAVPGVEQERSLAGPFVADLTEAGKDISVNLSGHDGRNFLGIGMRAEYAAYDEAYVPERTVDPLYKAMLDHRARVLLSDKTKEELTGKTGKEVLAEELREALDPILFPVHVGDAQLPTQADSESGLGPGLSSELGSWRGLYHEHVLHVDAPDRTLALDGGEKVAFREGDLDVRLVDPDGDVLFVDASRVDPEFVGDVRVGAMGRVRRIYFSSFIAQ